MSVDHDDFQRFVSGRIDPNIQVSVCLDSRSMEMIVPWERMEARDVAWRRSVRMIFSRILDRLGLGVRRKDCMHFLSVVDWAGNFMNDVCRLLFITKRQTSTFFVYMSH